MTNLEKIQNAVATKYDSSVKWIFDHAENRDEFEEVVDGVKYYVVQRYFTKKSLPNNLLNKLRSQVVDTDGEIKYVVNDLFDCIAMEFSPYKNNRSFEASFMICVKI